MSATIAGSTLWPTRPVAGEASYSMEMRRSVPWQRSAACAGKDTELFHLDDYISAQAPLGDIWADAPSSVIEAVGICARCPVRRPCLERAFALEKTYPATGGEPGEGVYRAGIYGGVTGFQREAVEHMEDRVEVLLVWFELHAWEAGLFDHREVMSA